MSCSLFARKLKEEQGGRPGGVEVGDEEVGSVGGIVCLAQLPLAFRHHSVERALRLKAKMLYLQSFLRKGVSLGYVARSKA